MGGVDRPTQEDLLRVARDPDFARQAVDRWGIDAIMHPVVVEQRGAGLGDVVAKVTSTLGVKPCEPCEERRRKLNRFRLGG